MLFKSLVSRHNWDDSEAMVNLKIKKRGVDTVNGESPFVYFDSADMQRRLPSKPSEVVFCRQQPTPPGCKTGHGFDNTKGNFGKDVLQNRTNNMMSLVDENDDFYLMLEDSVHRISMQHKTQNLLSSAGRHDVLRKSSLSRIDSFQKSYSYKASVRPYVFRFVFYSRKGDTLIVFLVQNFSFQLSLSMGATRLEPTWQRILQT